MAKLNVEQPKILTRPSESEAEEMVPQLGGTQRGRELPPSGPPMPAFYLAVHPLRWCVMGGQVVPQDRRVSFSSGVNGVEFDENRRPKLSQAVATAEEEGWTIIPWDVEGAGRSYLKRVKSTGGWTTKWEALHPGTEDITCDEAGAAKFWRGLIDAGKIPSPAPHALDALIGKLRSALEQDLKRHHGREPTERIKALTGQIKVAEEARAKLGKAPPSEAVEETPRVG